MALVQFKIVKKPWFIKLESLSMTTATPRTTLNEKSIYILPSNFAVV